MALSQSGSNTFSSPYTAQAFSESFDAGSAARTTLVVSVHYSSGTDTNGYTINTPQYNGTGLTEILVQTELYAGGRVEHEGIYYLNSPATGSNTLTTSDGNMVSGTPGNHYVVSAYVLTDCSGLVTGQFDGDNGNIAAHACTPSSNTTSTSLICGGVGGVAQRDWTMTTGTEIAAVGAGGGGANHNHIAGYEAATGGSDTWNASATTATRSSSAAAEFGEDLGGGGGLGIPIAYHHYRTMMGA